MAANVTGVLDEVSLVLEPLMGVLPFALIGVVVVAIVRAISLDRFGRARGRPVWTAGLAGMAAAAVGVPVLWVIAVATRDLFPRSASAPHWDLFPPIYTAVFALVYLAPVALAALLAHRRAPAEQAAAARIAGIGTAAYLVLIYPLVNFFNSCLLGHGILLPAGCN